MMWLKYVSGIEYLHRLSSDETASSKGKYYKHILLVNNYLTNVTLHLIQGLVVEITVH